MRKEYLSLLNNQDIEKNPSVIKLIADFQNALPKHFKTARFIVAPLNTTLSHVIRADCANENCRVRACVHVSRNAQGSLEIEEKKTKRHYKNFIR